MSTGIETTYGEDTLQESREFDFTLHPSIYPKLHIYLLPFVVFGIIYALAASGEFNRHFFPLGGYIYSVWFHVFAGTTALLFILAQEIRRRSELLQLNIDYLIHRQGILFRKISKVYFTDIKNILIRQSLIHDRIMKTGTIHIATAGTGGYEVSLYGFRHPQAIVRYIQVHRKEGE